MSEISHPKIVRESLFPFGAAPKVVRKENNFLMFPSDFTSRKSESWIGSCSQSLTLWWWASRTRSYSCCSCYHCDVCRVTINMVCGVLVQTASPRVVVRGHLYLIVLKFSSEQRGNNILTVVVLMSTVKISMRHSSFSAGLHLKTGWSAERRRHRHISWHALHSQVWDECSDVKILGRMEALLGARFVETTALQWCQNILT